MGLIGSCLLGKGWAFFLLGFFKKETAKTRSILLGLLF